MRTISRGVTGAVLIAMSAIACTSESDTRSLPGQTPAATGTASTNAALAASLLNEKDMIVIFRDQMENLRAKTDMGVRASVFAKVHAPFIADLQAAKPRTATSFGVLNAFATKLSTTEIETLSNRSEILAIVPNGLIRRPELAKDSKRVAGGRGGPGTASPALCNTLEPEALQVTNTAFLDPTIPSTQNLLDGNGKKITGKGVKVAWIADGINPNDPGFIRADGTHVFIDYQDFSGDGPDAVTAGAEAYGDASSIAAADKVYDISKFVLDPAALHLPTPCNIHVRGMAPDASLVGLKVFSELGYTTTANFVQAIEYAVSHDGVDVLNESFGGNPVVDDTKDPISLANAAATRAGVTVVVSTGDAGTAGTLGSPSTAKDAIAAGASTTFRAYQQTGDGIPLYNGYISNNISGLSSGGFAQKRARTVDLVAPGDLGWSLCSTDLNNFYECGNYSAPSGDGFAALPLQVFGGTSESAPLTSGAAALIIQAYRSTHGGADPTPKTVKAILMGSAQDLGAPADEQGAGLINTLKAATMAMSLQDENGSPAPKGAGLLSSPSSFNFTAQPYDIIANEFDVTNTGASFRVVTPALQKLGGATAGATSTVTIDTLHGPTYTNVAGNKRPYTTTTFYVPAGVDHLDGSVAFQGTSSQVVAFELVDPTGKLAAYSIPQGAGANYGHIDVVKPAAGQWTAYFRTSPSPAGYTGPIKFTWAAEKYVPAGVVFPPVAFLAPGQQAHFVAALATNGQAGDSAAAVRFGDDAGEIPVTVRTLVGTGPHGGSFTATLTGGNGRGDSPTQTYAFDVPAGLSDLGIKLTTQDAGYSLAAFLVDPNGKALSSASTIGLPKPPAADGTPTPSDRLTSLQLNHADPEPGRWSLVIEETAAAGKATSSPFTGVVEFDNVDIKAPALPTNKNTKVSKASGLSAPVTIKNNSSVAQSYFADARLKGSVQLPLQTFVCSSTTPITVPGFCGINVVPPRSTAAAFIFTSDKPVAMDAAWGIGGGPDLYAKTVAPNTVAATLQTTEVPYNIWETFPAQIGPYPSGVTAEDFSTSATVGPSAFVLTSDFDPAVTSSFGDFWADNQNGTATFSTGLVLQPGQTGTLDLHIAIDDATAVGTVVKGFVSIDTINLADPSGMGNEVITLPYAYTVKR